MSFLIILFSICLVIGIGILIWFKTPKGKNGLQIYNAELR